MLKKRELGNIVGTRPKWSGTGFTTNHRRNKWDLYWLGTSWKPIAFYFRAWGYLPNGQDGIPAQILCINGLLILYRSQTTHVIRDGKRQGFSQNKTELDTAFKIVFRRFNNITQLIALSDNSALHQWTRSKETGFLLWFKRSTEAAHEKRN